MCFKIEGGSLCRIKSKFIEYADKFHYYHIDTLHMLSLPYYWLSIRTAKYLQQSTFFSLHTYVKKTAVRR